MERQEHSAHSGLAGMTTSLPSLNSLFASVSAPLIPSPTPPPEFDETPTFIPIPPMAPSSFNQPIAPMSAQSIGLSSTSHWLPPSDPPTLTSAPFHSLFEATSSLSQELVEPESRRRPRRAAAMAAREAISAVTKRPDRSPKRRAAPAEDESFRSKKKARGFDDEQFAEKVPKTLKSPPNAKDDAKYETEEAGAKPAEKCCICMSEPERRELASVNGCDHHFCFDCIAKWAERENTCPLCKYRFTKITRVHKARKRTGKTPLNSKEVKERNQRSDLVSGAALEAMLNSIAASNRNASLGVTSLGGNRLGRVLLTMGSGSVSNRRAHAAPRPISRRAALFVEDSVVESDEDSSDGGLTLPVDFNELMRHTMVMARRRDSRPVSRRTPVIGLDGAGFPHPPPAGATFMVPPMYGVFQQPPHHHQSAPGPTQRSYASNMNDSTAGRAAENPLQIDDSDDDDDVVEVIAPPPSSRT